MPAARSAILRIFHLGGVTVERVDVLPPAQERPLGAALGPVVGAAAARTALGAPVRLPKLEGATPLHLRDRVVSVLLATPQPVLLSEFRDGAFLLKKIAGGTTRIVYVRLGNGPGLWIAGARHVFALPDAPPRLAGNVLVWQLGPITYRLEGRALTKQTALELADRDRRNLIDTPGVEPTSTARRVEMRRNPTCHGRLSARRRHGARSRADVVGGRAVAPGARRWCRDQRANGAVSYVARLDGPLDQAAGASARAHAPRGDAARQLGHPARDADRRR